MRDLGDADVGIGEHRPRSLNVIVRKFRRTASRAAALVAGSSQDWAPSISVRDSSRAVLVFSASDMLYRPFVAGLGYQRERGWPGFGCPPVDARRPTFLRISLELGVPLKVSGF
jgi:hypothetical protein